MNSKQLLLRYNKKDYNYLLTHSYIPHVWKMHIIITQYYYILL